jgi:hypothetical protein
VEIKRDSDEDGLPDSWEMRHFGSVDKADPDAVSSNGVNKIRDAYIGGFSPIDSNAGFGISEFRSQGEDKVLSWDSVSGRVYRVLWTTNLMTDFQCLESNIPWTRGIFTNSATEPSGFYKIDVQLAE